MVDTLNINSPETLNSLRPYLERGLEVVRLISGKMDRPIGIAEGPFPDAYKMYFAISRARQEDFGIEKPADHLVALLREGSSPLYLTLSALVDDATFLQAPNKYGLSLEQAERVVATYPATHESVGTPFFTHSPGGKMEVGLLDLDRMQGRALPTDLIVHDLEKYPSTLLRKWNHLNSESLPIVALPTPLAKAMGLRATGNTNSPAELGHTVVDGGVGTLIVEEQEYRVFFGGALNVLGVSGDFAQDIQLDFERPYAVEALVGQEILRLMKTKPDSVIEATKKAALEILEEEAG